MVPDHLYKVLSTQDWQESQGMASLQLSAADRDFIHFSTEDQLQKIIEKYWSHVSKCVVLKIDASKLKGRLVFEANRGGENKYYHLYEGCIPLDSIVESNVKSV